MFTLDGWIKGVQRDNNLSDDDIKERLESWHKTKHKKGKDKGKDANENHRQHTPKSV